MYPTSKHYISFIFCDLLVITVYQQQMLFLTTLSVSTGYYDAISLKIVENAKFREKNLLFNAKAKVQSVCMPI